MILLISCNKDDGPNEQASLENKEETENKIYGQWKVLSGNLSFGESKFIHFNTDNTIHLLEENDYGFRSDLKSAITIEKDSITIIKAEQSPRKIGYLFENDKLIITQKFGSNIRLERITEITPADDWIKTLSVLDKRNMSWNTEDITFDGEHILSSSSYETKIRKINPHTFEIVGSDDDNGYIGLSALDIEKSDSEFRQLFKSFGDLGEYPIGGFSSYIYRSNSLYYSSNSIEVSITGLASEIPGHIWAASRDKKELYSYKSNGALMPGEILKTISLDIRSNGLDYRDGFLYIVSGCYIHKCNVAGELMVMQTYKIPGYYFSGITHDGDNFILSAFDSDADTYAILRTDLSI